MSRWFLHLDMLEQGLHRIGIDTSPLRRINWTRWLLALFAIGAAVWVGLNAPRTFLAGRTGFEVFLYGALMLIGVALILYRIELGVMAIVFTSFFVRFTISTGTSSAIPASLVMSIVAVSIWILSMLLRRRVQLVRGRYVLPTIIFIVISLFSVPYSWLLLRPDLFVYGRAAHTSLGFTVVQLGGVAMMILLPAVMLMVANVFKREVWFKVMFWVVVIVAIPELLSRLHLLHLSFLGFTVKTGASYSLWVVALAVGQAFFNTAFPRWFRAALLGIAGIWLYYGAELGATWFSGWMPAAVALLFLAFMRSRKLFLVLLVIGLFLLSLRADHYIAVIWGDAVKYDSNRFDIWRIIIFDLTLTKTNIFFGAGPAGYLPFYERYYPGNAWSSHNNYVDIFAETGLVGFAVFLWMLFAIFMTGWTQRKEMPTPFLAGFNYGALAGFAGTLCAMGLGDWHIPFVYNIGIPGFDFAVYGWLVSGAMLALQHMRVAAPIQHAEV